MLLSSNSEKVTKLVFNFEDLSNENKIRLVIALIEDSELEDKIKEDIIYYLKKILFSLKIINTTLINLSANKIIIFFLAKNMELSKEDKKHFLIETLFNIYSTDFDNKEINDFINQNLNVYEYYYNLFNDKEI